MQRGPMNENLPVEPRRMFALGMMLTVVAGVSPVDAADAPPVPVDAPDAQPAAADAPPEPPAPADAQPAAADAPPEPPEEDDGQFDISDFLDKKFGFLPIVKPITEPAIGYGASGGLLFLSKPLGAAAQGLGRPNITAVGGFGTSNGSWGGYGVDLRYWGDTRIQTMFALIGASINLDYYGVGKDSVLQDDPLRYNLQPLGGLAQAKYRFGETRFWAGVGYSFASTRVTFDVPPALENPELEQRESRSNVGLFRTFVTYDNRDNVFTPLRGTFIELTSQLSQTWLGSDNNFERLSLVGIQYIPLPHQLFWGIRGDAGASFGDAPFYMRPSIALRGVAAMRYQGEEIASIETELRWQFYGRWSVLGFMGGGGAWNHFEQLDNSQGVLAGGGGFRYELARRYGIHAGIDVAGSRDTAAVYLQVGSAWMRP